MSVLSRPHDVDPVDEIEHLGAEKALAYAAERFGERLAVACSFQKENSVIVDIVSKIAPKARLFTLDTDVLFPETYETWHALEERYGRKIEVFKGLSLEEQAARYGDELWARDPDACCGIRKVTPLRRALEGMECWVGGLRREHSPDRASTPKLAWDKAHGLWKLSPLADWTEKDVWRYIFANDIPYNALHDRGYSSIGCTHCTQPGDGREGRWAGSEKDECGLHVERPGQS